MMSHSKWWSMRPPWDGSSWSASRHTGSSHSALSFKLSGDESSVGVTSLTAHKIFTNICPAPDHVWVFATTVCHEKVPKVTSVPAQTSGEESIRVTVVCCCYSFYRNKCFVSSEYGRESSLSGRLYLYGTLTSQAFITLKMLGRYQVKNGDSGSTLFHHTSLQSAKQDTTATYLA